MISKTLYIDVDSTLWPAEKEYDYWEQRLHGTQELCKYFFTADELAEKYGDVFYEIIRRALDPDKMHERELYDGAAEVLCNLYHGMHGGFDLHFISHNFFAKDTKPALRKWLESVMHV